MIDYKTLFSTSAFDKIIKKNFKWYLDNQKKLCTYHYSNSKDYKKITKSLFKPINQAKSLSELPFMHVSVFKNFNIKSNINEKNISTFSSSGTTGSIKSKINLDPKTSILQIRALQNIFQEIFDTNTDIFFLEKSDFLNSKKVFTAKGAAVKGFSQLANNKYFLINKYNKLDLSFLKKYLKKNPTKKFVIFGFTSQIWSKLILKLVKKKIKIKKNNGILIHGGGWKRLANIKIDNISFKKEVKKKLGVKKIYDYYGMIEQTGSIFLECEEGFFHCSIFSDILIRDASLQLCKQNEIGLVQVFSLLPTSYPGHNILTEDLGKIIGNNNCKCGKGGRYFSIIGRVPNTDLRGCSDAI